MAFLDELDKTLHLDPQHPCYERWRQYHLTDIERGVAIARFIDSRLPLRSARVLDVGCGLGGLSIALARAGARVTGIDLSCDQIRLAKLRVLELAIPGIEFLASGGEGLPFDSSSFDLVTLNDVIEHFASPSQAISEVSRVLKLGGGVYALAPNRHSLSVTFCDPHYQLPFVVWLPQRWRDRIIRRLGRGQSYDGNWFPSINELIALFAANSISIRPVGFFKYGAPRLCNVSVWRKLICGYPVFWGTRDRSAISASAD